jgi:hypothetical protein
VEQLEEEAVRLAAQLRTFVAESQYELGAEWPEQIFKPVLGKKGPVSRSGYVYKTTFFQIFF